MNQYWGPTGTCVLVVGYSGRAEEFVDQLDKLLASGFRLVGTVHIDRTEERGLPEHKFFAFLFIPEDAA
jgi:hypothetical protein